MAEANAIDLDFSFLTLLETLVGLFLVVCACMYSFLATSQFLGLVCSDCGCFPLGLLSVKDMD